ncbi:MAG: Uncharacterised protein [Synechococcus sp. CC9902]|nr:MAG: Uncharacterised protein [Synechococcus sp. CC9902]
MLKPGGIVARLAHPSGLAPQLAISGQPFPQKTIHLILGVSLALGWIQRPIQKCPQPPARRWRHHGTGHHSLQHPGGGGGAESIAIGVVITVKPTLAAVGTIAPCLLATVDSLQLRPVELAQPVVHQTPLSLPQRPPLPMKLRATAGTTEQIHNQAGGVIA